ncbi:Uncharacterised protein [Mycobacterium tuberculosis]|uniref:Uncharacterized protein n=1 Tax=Mycobacterium tuberculosis TaxID=1773 RepID=A0A654TQI6_MYCTX|nr:Uncharacterised protein [Mycobacterium tuberculosis]
MPGVLVQVAAADQSQQAAPEGILRSGEPSAQSFQSTFGRRDGVSLGDLWSLGFWLKLGKVYVGDRALGRVARDGRIVAHGGQSARIDPLGRLGRRRLTKRDARRCGVTA